MFVLGSDRREVSSVIPIGIFINKIYFLLGLAPLLVDGLDRYVMRHYNSEIYEICSGVWHAHRISPMDPGIISSLNLFTHGEFNCEFFEMI